MPPPIALTPRTDEMTATRAAPPPTPNDKLDEVYRAIVDAYMFPRCGRTQALGFIRGVLTDFGDEIDPGEKSTILKFLEWPPPPIVLGIASKIARSLASRPALEDHLRRLEADIAADRGTFAPEVNAERSSGRRIVFVTDRPQFAILREAMYLVREGHHPFLLSLAPIDAEIRWVFERHFVAVADACGSYRVLDAILDLLRPEVFHVECKMWNYVLARQVIEHRGDAAIVCDFYDITSVYAGREALCSLWSAVQVDLDIALERYILHNADAIVHRFPPHVVDEVRDRHGAMPPETAMYAYPCPEFTAYAETRPSQSDGIVRLVYAGTTIPVNADHPPRLFPEAGMPRAFRRLLEQGFAIDILGNPHSPVSDENPSYTPFLTLGRNYPCMRVLDGVPPDQLSETLAPYDFGILVMVFDDSVLRIGHGQRTGVVANKIFSYLEAGLPVIVSAEYEEMARIVREHGLGLAVASDELPALGSILEEFDYATAAANVRRYNETHGMAQEIGRLIALYDAAVDGRRS